MWRGDRLESLHDTYFGWFCASPDLDCIVQNNSLKRFIDGNYCVKSSLLSELWEVSKDDYWEFSFYILCEDPKLIFYQVSWKWRGWGMDYFALMGCILIYPD